MDEDKTAFHQVVKAMARDMPLVMHGSGDVPPSHVNPESVRILSELTANYISNLVHAAVDAHEMLNDGPKPLPPPCWVKDPSKSRQTPLPAPYEPPTDDGATTTTTSNSKASSAAAAAAAEKEAKEKKDLFSRKRRRRAADEFWDEPLPDPKIKGKPATKAPAVVPTVEGVSVDEWVGVSGVDFWEEENRTRRAHVAAPAAIATQCFIFPICHDGGLYGKVREVQKAQVSLGEELADPVIQQMMRNEGKAALLLPGRRHKKRDKKKRAKNDEDDIDQPEPEETDSADEREGAGGGAKWPGLESLLPIHNLLGAETVTTATATAD